MSSQQLKKSSPRDRIARNLKSWRVKRGISQENLSANAGISQTFLSQIERGMRNVSIDTLDRLAESLEIDISELLETVGPAKKHDD